MKWLGVFLLPLDGMLVHLGTQRLAHHVPLTQTIVSRGDWFYMLLIFCDIIEAVDYFVKFSDRTFGVMQITNTWPNYSKISHIYAKLLTGAVLVFLKEVVMNQQYGLEVLKHQHPVILIRMGVI